MFVYGFTACIDAFLFNLLLSEVSRLMWHMFIVSRVETAALLMEEVWIVFLWNNVNDQK